MERSMFREEQDKLERLREKLIELRRYL